MMRSPKGLKRNIELSALSALEELEAKIGFEFSDIEMLRVALDWKRAREASLPFLGDSFLKAIYTAELLERFPKEDGSHIVGAVHYCITNEFLSKVAERISLYDYQDPVPKRGPRVFYLNKYAGTAVESLIGAAFRDKGYEGARKVVSTLLAPEIAHPSFQRAVFYKNERSWHASEELKYNGDERDLRLVLSREISRPPQFVRYLPVENRLPSESIVVRAEVSGMCLAYGVGTSLLEAELDAARKALGLYRSGEFKKPEYKIPLVE